jgi:hypothetical protein
VAEEANGVWQKAVPLAHGRAARNTTAAKLQRSAIRESDLEVMPGKKHLRGASSKEQRQYEHIKKSAEKSGRYGKRAKEVAARTVMKQKKKQRK